MDLPFQSATKTAVPPNMASPRLPRRYEISDQRDDPALVPAPAFAAALEALPGVLEVTVGEALAKLRILAWTEFWVASDWPLPSEFVKTGESVTGAPLTTRDDVPDAKAGSSVTVVGLAEPPAAADEREGGRKEDQYGPRRHADSTHYWRPVQY